jgi:hypothetical protein
MMVKNTLNQLPTEILPNTTWRRIIWLILLTLVMLIFTNLFVLAYLDRYSMNYGYWTIHQKWNLLDELDKPVDWLVLGDSSCSQGVDPEVIKTELNQTAINLCTTGDMGTLDNLWMLEEYIQRHGPPKSVLILHTFDMWYRDFDPVRLGQVPRAWKFWEDHTFGSGLMANEDIRWETFLEHYVPLYSQIKTTRMIIRSTLSGKHNPLVSIWEMTKDGFVPAFEPKPDIVLAGEQQQINFASENTFQVSNMNDKALRKMVELAEMYNFNLFLANAPVYTGLYNNPEYQEYNQNVQSYLQSVADESDKVQHIESVKTFPVEQMQNPDHLIVSGAEEFTQWLVQEIQQAGR